MQARGPCTQRAGRPVGLRRWQLGRPESGACKHGPVAASRAPGGGGGGSHRGASLEAAGAAGGCSLPYRSAPLSWGSGGEGTGPL